MNFSRCILALFAEKRRVSIAAAAPAPSQKTQNAQYNYVPVAPLTASAQTRQFLPSNTITTANFAVASQSAAAHSAVIQPGTPKSVAPTPGIIRSGQLAAPAPLPPASLVPVQPSAAARGTTKPTSSLIKKDGK